MWREDGKVMQCPTVSYLTASMSARSSGNWHVNSNSGVIHLLYLRYAQVKQHVIASRLHLHLSNISSLLAACGHDMTFKL